MDRNLLVLASPLSCCRSGEAFFSTRGWSWYQGSPQFWLTAQPRACLARTQWSSLCCPAIRRWNIFPCPVWTKILESVIVRDKTLLSSRLWLPLAKVYDLWLLITLSLSSISLGYINHKHKSTEANSVMTGVYLSTIFSSFLPDFISFFAVLCQCFPHSFFPMDRKIILAK